MPVDKPYRDGQVFARRLLKDRCKGKEPAYTAIVLEMAIGWSESYRQLPILHRWRFREGAERECPVLRTVNDDTA